MAHTVAGRVVIQKPGSQAKQPSEQERIFVAIASYRDTECQWTVKDLFEKAAKPERIFVGICWQIVPTEDRDCFEVASPHPAQTRIVTFHVSQSEGVGWARAQAHKLWMGEEYVLNIDSHMRFVEGWDERMLAQLKACRAIKPLLSTYPPGYVPPDKLNPPTVPMLCGGYFDETGVQVNKSRAVQPEDAPSAPIPSMLYAAGFAFASSQVLKEVPYDPFIYFQGEEISMATRLWTHGWDLFAPNEVLLYHAYGKNTSRKTHWVDNRDWPKLNARSRARVAHLIGSKPCQDAEALVHIEAYSLGGARSLDDYQRYSGMDFSRKTIAVSAIEGQFPLVRFDPKREALKRKFTDLWTSNGYGNFETHSGAGSTLRATRSLRPWLADTLKRLGIQSLLDAGCGDAVWIAELAEGLALYIGADVVDAQIDINRQVHRGRLNMLFKEADITRDVLPRTDMILCRDTLTHLPDADVQKALACFRRSGARYLLATHVPGAAAKEIEMGGWRAIDLAGPPFSLGNPREGFVESSEAGKTLSIWQLAD
jgi:SAM-dependent methyltransferase